MNLKESDSQNVNYQEKYEKISKEFEEFVYIISHDLQAPLRHTREFNKMLLKNLSEENDAQQFEYVKRIEQGVSHSEAMIAGMLKYSRLNTDMRVQDKVNLTELISKIVEDKKALFDEHDIALSFEDMPEMLADESQMHMLFSELIQNSINFRNANRALEIKIASEKIDNGYLFNVEDNGNGIKSRDKDTVFEIFRPLRNFGKQQNIGVGMGLTIAKKIVEIHNGEISINTDAEYGVCVDFNIIELAK